MYSIKSKTDLVEKARKDIGNIQLSNVFCSDVMSKSLKIPEFQRYFEWDESNVHRLLDDIFQLTRTNRSTVGKIVYNEETDYKFNTLFMGAIIVQSNSKNYVIDGQQRLTSLLMVYCVIDNIYHYLLNEVPSNFGERNPKLKYHLEQLLKTYRDEDQDFLSLEEVKESLFRLDIASSSQHRTAIRNLTNRIFRRQSLIEFRKIERRIIQLRKKLRFLDNQEGNGNFDHQKKREMTEILNELYSRLTNDLESPSPNKLNSLKKRQLMAPTTLSIFPEPHLWLVYIFDLVLKESDERLSTHLKRLLETFNLIYDRMIHFLGDLARIDIDVDFESLDEENRKGMVEDLLQATLSVLFTVSYSLWFAYFEVPEHLNVFEIFETINSTGKNLSQSDLVKYALISYSSNEQKNEIEDKWDQLVLEVEKINENSPSKIGFENLIYYHFLTRLPEVNKIKQPKSRFGRILIEEFDKNKIPRHPDERDRWIRGYLDEIKNIVTIFSMLYLTPQTLYLSPPPSCILNYHGVANNFTLSEDVVESLYAITYFLKYENLYPLLFKIINSIDPNYWIDFLRHVEQIIVHNALTRNLSPTQLLNISVTVIENSVWTEESKNYDAFIETLDFLENEELLLPKAPKDFIASYLQIKLKKEAAYYLLRKIALEEIKRKNLFARFPIHKVGEIEQIFLRRAVHWPGFLKLPAPDREILEKQLGNYVILEIPMKSNIRNGKFSGKQYHFSNEKLSTTNEVSKLNTWSPEEITERTRTLAEKLFEIYSEPL